MNEIEYILKVLKMHGATEEKLNEVKKSYDLAFEIHKTQFRQSGEPYIIHPLAVAINILNMEIYDPDTISAALLHDTVEDAKGQFSTFSKEDIACLINPVVAKLVDGVTKISKMNFNSKQEQNLANIRKIINGLNIDVRIILIKLADRLHNMRTLDFKKPEKQRENSEETLQLFVPLALTLGAYQIKSELEDLSFKYILPDDYKRITEQKSLIAKCEEVYLKEMAAKIQAILNTRNVPNDIIVRTKNAYTTYKKIVQGYKLENIYDLFYLKILVDEVEECYQTLAIVHKNNPPINGRFKDYIYNPRTNLYQSLHTTVSDKNNKLVKVKIRTHDMDKVSAFGISARWNIKGGQTIEESQKEIQERCQFAKKLIEIDESFEDNRQFVQEIKNELLTEHVYVYNHSGEIFELPHGSTGIDFVCHVCPEKLDTMTAIIINGKEEAASKILNNNDRIQVITKSALKEANTPKQFQKKNQ